MPNWVRNEMTIKGPEESIRALLGKVRTKESRFDFNGLVPMPTTIYRENLSAADRMRYGEDNWYDWSVKHWGTKWNASDAGVAYHGGDTALVDFETAWSAPVPIFKAIREQFPLLDVYVRFADEAIGSNCGEWHNGEFTDHECPEEAIKFACDVWGWDPEKEMEDL